MNKNDVAILRELAKQYAEIAFSDANKGNMLRMHRINGLNPIRPAVYIEELPWHEMDIDGQLALRCEDPACREFEDSFRKSLFRHKYFPADTVYIPYVPVRKVVRSTGIGMNVEENVAVTDERNAIRSHEYIDQLKEERDLDRLHAPVIRYDKAETDRRYQMAQSLFEGVLPVKCVGHPFSWTPWDDISRFRGVEALLMDLALRPEFMHKIMGHMLAIAEATVDQYEKLGLLSSDEYTVHCTAGLSGELPAAGFDGVHARPADMWGRGAAQIFGSVSVDMHDEFDITYMRKFMEKFGLVYYGCCEPLHDKIHIVEKIPHLRKISITPWAKVEPAAEAIGGKYVFAFKPNPAFVAESGFDRERVREEILTVLKACRKNNVTCEFALKDISTCNRRPENIFQWEKTVMETVEQFG